MGELRGIVWVDGELSDAIRDVIRGVASRHGLGCKLSDAIHYTVSGDESAVRAIDRELRDEIPGVVRKRASLVPPILGGLSFEQSVVEANLKDGAAAIGVVTVPELGDPPEVSVALIYYPRDGVREHCILVELRDRNRGTFRKVAISGRLSDARRDGLRWADEVAGKHGWKIAWVASTHADDAGPKNEWAVRSRLVGVETRAAVEECGWPRWMVRCGAAG